MSSIPTETKVHILANPPVGPLKSDTFKLTTRPLPELKDGQVLVKMVAWSNDPAQRTWMDGDTDPRRLYAPPIEKNQSINSGGIAQVIATKSSKWKEGQKVLGQFGWYEYGVVDEGAISSEAQDLPNHSEFISLSFLGMTGLTAYFGLLDIAKAKKEHVVVVSGAAGAVGSVVVQIAKNVLGCKTVIGIAGGKAKCDWVKSIGADDCVDYKSGNYKEALVKLLPDYADVFFDNVGGEVLDTMLPLTKRYGTIAVCGAIANYNGGIQQLANWREVVYNRINIHGFIVIDHLKDAPKAIGDLAQWVNEKKLDVTEGETVVETKFEDVPETWKRLFEGANQGKLITKLV